MVDKSSIEGLMLTFSDVVERPLVVFEEGVPFDFLHAVSAQPHLPQKKTPLGRDDGFAPGQKTHQTGNKNHTE